MRVVYVAPAKPSDKDSAPEASATLDKVFFPDIFRSSSHIISMPHKILFNLVIDPFDLSQPNCYAIKPGHTSNNIYL